jgi:long-chain acyl-CoA synthetase
MSYLADRIAAVLTVDETRPALFFKDQVYSWGDVRRMAEGLKTKLDELGLGEAAGVGCLLRTRPEHYAAILGVTLGERCIVTLNPIMPDERLAEDIRAMRPPVVVGAADDWARPAVVQAAHDIGAAGLLLTGDPAAPIASVPGLETVGPGPHIEPQPGVAVLMLTSGTTGKPKRAPLRYRQLELNIKRAARADKNWTEDAPPTLKDQVGIMFSPFVHISGMYFVFSSTIGGIPARLLERFSVEEWRKAVQEIRPPTGGGPPTVLKMILDANLPKEDFASFVAMSSGTAPTDPSIIDEYLRRYDLPVLTTYGATEFAGAVCGWSLGGFRKYWETKRGAAGRMHPGVEARTVDPETGEPLAPGEPGVLELRSEVVGVDGQWVRTSDLARIDEDHYLWVLGRNDNAIIRGGFKVMPDSVVKALEEHPAIREASVVGLPDARLGAVPVAAYIVKTGAEPPSEAELSTFLRERLSAYQIPVAFRQVDELPRTPSLKVSMPGVRALFEEAQVT